ncbi:TPA: minor capsid protein [Streptococcus pyogenes]|nr:minor capsid protein [Streptococcus pyogenes]
MIDKRLLIDKLQVKLVKEKGDYGGFVYDEPFILSPVRFDRNLSTAGKDNARQETKPSVIFIYSKYCKVAADRTWVDAAVLDGNTEYIVDKVIPVYHPLTNKVFCYEVEVI